MNFLFGIVFRIDMFSVLLIVLKINCVEEVMDWISGVLFLCIGIIFIVLSVVCCFGE